MQFLLLARTLYQSASSLARRKFVGTIGLRDIFAYCGARFESGSHGMDIVHTKKDVAVVNSNYTLTDVLHKLVDESFRQSLISDGIPRDYHTEVN